MSVVYDYNDFPINNLHFSDPLKTSGGSYIGKSYIKKSHSKKETDFYIQLPKLVCSNISLNHPDSRNYIEFELHAKNLDALSMSECLNNTLGKGKIFIPFCIICLVKSLICCL